MWLQTPMVTLIEGFRQDMQKYSCFKKLYNLVLHSLSLNHCLFFTSNTFSGHRKMGRGDSAIQTVPNQAPLQRSG